LTQAILFFRRPDLVATLGVEYEVECHQLCVGPYSSWTEVRARFQELKKIL
jgi:hypothetical protein